MITVTHYKTRGRSYRKAISNYGRLAFWRASYATAYTKPNYPMPAIPTVVDIEPDYVVLFQWIGPEMTGEYIRETILS